MQSKRTSPGDVFSTFLDTVRGDDPSAGAPIFSALRLLKVAGPQPLEKLLKIVGSESPNLMDNLLRAAEEGFIVIGDSPKYPNDTAVTITQRGEDLLDNLKQQKS